MKRRQDVKVLFGRRLRELRRGVGLSQEELADLAGLDRSYVGGVERGERNISLENICKLAAAMEVPPKTLLDLLT
jgi:transcriptional regulator with XRE-family HTH domain